MSTAAAAAPSMASSRVAFVRARLASALAIFPLGVWTVVHVWNNLASWSGAEAWQSSVTNHEHPAAVTLTSIVVLLPLLLHTLWGIGKMRASRLNNGSYRYYANFKFLLQRLSAVGVLLFIGAHLWLAFLHPRLQLGHPETFADIASEMRHNTPTLVVYLLGTLGVSYHLANGAHSFLMAWGAIQSRASLRRLEGAALLFFAIMLAMSWGAIYGLWTAGA